MNKNVKTRTINNISYNIERVFNGKRSVEDIIRKIIEENPRIEKYEKKAFTDKNSHDIIINE